MTEDFETSRRRFLKNKANDVLRVKLNKQGYLTEQQEQEEREKKAASSQLPRCVEELPPRGLVLTLTAGQRWRREFSAVEEWYRSKDPDHVKYLGFRWCSASRVLVFFDCRNFERGAYVYADPAQYF